MMKIEWSPLAKEQLREILAFYTHRNGSPRYSKRLKKEIGKAIRLFQKNPHFGEKLPGHDNRRRTSVGNFVVICEHENNVVYVRSIRDGRRDDE